MMNTPDSPEQSPDIFAAPKKGPGGKKMNALPAAIASTIGVVVLMVVIYTADDRKHAAAQSNDAIENSRTSSASVAPIKRPEGPDVDPVQVAQVAPFVPGEMPVAPGLSEAERKALEKRIADREAAMKASPRVQGSAMSQQQQYQQNAPMMQPGNLMGFPPPPPAPGPENEGDINQQAQKREFLKASEDKSPYLKHSRMAPLFPTELKAGSIIPGVMISGINSDLPGQIIGQVRQNVYDTASGRFVLIPAGSRLVGSYDSDVSAGQERVLVAWTRVIFPDGSSLSLDTMPGADKSGVAGMHDKVNNHYLRTFGQAALLSLFTAASQLSQTRGSVSGNYSASQILAAQVGMQGFNLGSQLIRRNLNIQPTLEIRPGMEFSVAVTKDMGLPEWRGHPLASNVSSVD